MPAIFPKEGARRFGHPRELSRFAGLALPRPRNFDTGVPWIDAETDFTRARRQHMLSRLVRWLRREPDDTSLLRFDEVVSVLGFRGEHYLGPRTIRLDTVVGTVEEAHDFDRGFRPTSDRDRERWELLDLAERRNTVTPPIEVYRVGGLHFVKDGHHRVSVALATGQQTIDADVTEVLTQLPATGIFPPQRPAEDSQQRGKAFIGMVAVPRIAQRCSGGLRCALKCRTAVPAAVPADRWA
jgi:hypothetical protein